ncbi:MAG: nucleotidyltransferase domain-containing protein [bacterium]|nr:nucleotidyltransferase domain-containing protein [bacterium]
MKKFITRLLRKYSIHRIYLFGSFARNQLHEGSDIDLIIVGDFQGKMFERIATVLQLTDLPIEPLVYTPDEFNKMRKQNCFLKKAIAESKRLYPENSYQNIFKV